MKYSQKGFEDRRPPMSARLIKQDNQSATVEMDLAEYLPLFRAANTGKIARGSQEYKKFQIAHATLLNYFNGMGGLNLIASMEDACLAHYSQEDRLKIINAPAYTLLHDSFRELLKNAVDAFLEHYLQNLDDESTKIKFNFDVQAHNNDEVSLIFSDSGTGFSTEILKNLENENKQLNYIHTRQRSKKRVEGTVGLLGGGAFGLRQLIHQVLTGKELKPGIKISRSRLFDSKILFSNDNNKYCRGGSIAITTSVAPIPDLENEASISIKTHRDSKIAYSPSPKKTVSDNSTHSSSSDTLVLDALSRLDIGENVKSKKGGLGLVLDIPDRDTQMYTGNSPMLSPKEQFGNFLPVVHTKPDKRGGLTKREQVDAHSVLPDQHSERVGRSKSRARAQPDNLSSDIHTQLMSLKEKYKLKLACMRDLKEKPQKSNSSQYRSSKKTS